MGPLLAYCPNTSKPIETGIENDPAGLKKSWDVMLRLDCPHCGKVHEIRVRDAFVQGEIAPARLRGVPNL